MPRDTIHSLAKEIQARWPTLVVKVERGHYSTDRKIGRLRWPGKGRTGTRIRVYRPWTPAELRAYRRKHKSEPVTPGELLLDHNNAAPYRRTSDVRAWMEWYAAWHSKRRKGRKR